MTPTATSQPPQPSGSALDPQMLAQIKAQMVDIIEPAAVGLWPLAWGWWSLIALGLSGIAIASTLFVQQRQRNRYRRHALSTLKNQHFDNALTQGQFLMHLSKQVALAAYPQERHHIASASGEAWLQWLNSKTQKPLFNTDGARQWQASLYAPVTEQTPDQPLTQTLHDWIKNHKQKQRVEVAHV